MPHQMNLCTSVLSNSRFDDAVAIALEAGFDGIELRVHDAYHQSLAALEERGPRLRRALEQRGLDIPLLNTYVGIDDQEQVSRLFACARKMGVPRLRLTLPRSAQASVAKLSREREIIPSYESALEPPQLIRHIRRRLTELESTAHRMRVKVFLELHWGTVMSSFSSAYLLLNGLDPACIGMTFDPANMIVEGREDWEYGLRLARDYIDNVHVKNAAWTPRGSGGCWEWAPVFEGFVDWSGMIALLQRIGYDGHFAVEDFLTGRLDARESMSHLKRVRATLAGLCRRRRARIAA